MGNKKFKIYTTKPSNCKIPTTFIDVDYSVPPSANNGMNSTDFW